ncbi:rod shape-determining protein [Actinoplanes sp. NPDC024001]|uniref:rod shape-determining protein n=1 Tax=Actinoplanes sp. NPDC024001 TaxID=3154598 RepID=UPI0033F878A2
MTDSRIVKGVGVTVPANLASSLRPADTPDTAAPTAVAVDLGSSTVGVWAAHRGTVDAPCGDAFTASRSLVRRGRIIDPAGCVALLSQLVRRFSQPIPDGGVVVACRPALAGDQDQAAMRGVLEEVFAPTRLVFIDTVRAAAIGSGAGAGSLLVADFGAQLTEVALLSHGRVITARRADIGTRDLTLGATVDVICGIVAQYIDELRDTTTAAELRPALTRGVLLVGGGAALPDLRTTLSAVLRLPVHRAASPRNAALNGAGLAAMSLLRRPAPMRHRAEPAGGPS